jgi:DNA polymerase III alpha subunit (gram-positive type)
MTDLIFLDIETTGLDPNRHQVWEIAYAVNDGPIECEVVAHSLAFADPKALEINGHTDRCNVITHSPAGYLGHDFEAKLEAALTGNTIIGANPAFDTAFLAARWRLAPWHHRMIDIESYAMPFLHIGRPVGMREIAEALGAPRLPDHSAAADVEALRWCYQELRGIYSEAPGRHRPE